MINVSAWDAVIWDLAGSGWSSSKMAHSYGCWLATSVPHHMGLSNILLESPHHMTVSCFQSEWSERVRGKEATVPFMTQFGKSHTVFLFVKSKSQSPAYIQREEKLSSPFWREICQNVCGCVLKVTLYKVNPSIYTQRHHSSNCPPFSYTIHFYISIW